MKNQIVILTVVLQLISCSQNQNLNSFTIDPTIEAEVEKNVTNIATTMMSSMDIKLIENDSVIVDTYKDGKRIDQCLTTSSLEGDTINITCFLGTTAGLGYNIKLINDQCFVSHFAKTDMEIYKLNKNDSLRFGVSVPSVSYDLTLTNQPEFKKGEVISGIVRFKSQNYYEVSSKGEKIYSAEMTGYFKTEPLMSTKEKYKKLLLDLQSN